ncbi:hypothetical protein [Reichenbachiella sp. MALMAid0571]
MTRRVSLVSIFPWRSESSLQFIYLKYGVLAMSEWKARLPEGQG